MIGMDEVGRGAWAGPLLVCAARLNKPVLGLKDSKKLSKKQREVLSAEILKNADIGYGWVSATRIDEIGLSSALQEAFQIAYLQIKQTTDELIIIDGIINYLPGVLNVENHIKADDEYPSVSAASIVAKVARDNYMAELSLEYPSYGFAKHVGYGTKIHSLALEQYGPLPKIHRYSFKPIK